MTTINKNLEISKLQICAIQIWIRKATTQSLNYGIWQIKWTKIEKFCTLDLNLITDYETFQDLQNR